MPTSEERFAILEQTVTTLRTDFLLAIVENTRSMTTLNKVILQQEESIRDADHEITILTGVVGSQGRDIKAIKDRLDGFDSHFVSLEDRFASLDGKVTSLDGRFTSLEEKVTSLDGKVTSLDGKLDQVLEILVSRK